MQSMFYVHKVIFVSSLLSKVVDLYLLAECGELNVIYRCHENHIDAELKLLPIISIQQNGSHRWHRYLKQEQGPEEVISEGDPKYEENNFTLTIHDFADSDNGTYTRDCTINGNLSRSDVEVQTNIECAPTTAEEKTVVTTPTSETGIGHAVQTSPTTVLLSETVIVVTAVCSVIIVVVIAGTILLVIRKRASTNAGASGLSRDGGGLAVNFQEEKEQSDIYNEIDLDNRKRDRCGFNSSKLTLLTLQNSPALPKRPPNNAKRIIKDIESEYDVIMDGTNNKKDDNTMKVSSKEIKHAANDEGYATIRQEEKSFKDGKKCKVFNNNNIPEYSQVLKRPEYATVHKHQLPGNTAEQSENSKDNKTYISDYNVVFPAIEYTNVVKCLDNNEQSSDMTTLEEPAKYCNIGPNRRSQVKHEERISQGKS
ncbi:uncharacterized protein LOC123559539 isoform X2 [Mercenaria mercenaria]|uniref:uncharacterized protein LOC123559539 isoform X2 n=1 Tax=Mercenaria mercenaria TaxID=6596 RepID=UPI00234E9B25|nr:uncharacterized protein LOC123559539 isoform X2 [Mercenaria mercenaria]